VNKALTEDDISAARTSAGGWTRETLAQWGVPWPPPKGWRRVLVADGLFRQGFNTAEIAGRLLEREHVIAKILADLRETRRAAR
jgi:hypothetical protein